MTSKTLALLWACNMITMCRKTTGFNVRGNSRCKDSFLSIQESNYYPKRSNFERWDWMLKLLARIAD